MTRTQKRRISRIAHRKQAEKNRRRGAKMMYAVVSDPDNWDAPNMRYFDLCQIGAGTETAQ